MVFQVISYDKSQFLYSVMHSVSEGYASVPADYAKILEGGFAQVPGGYGPVPGVYTTNSRYRAALAAKNCNIGRCRLPLYQNPLLKTTAASFNKGFQKRRGTRISSKSPI